MVAKEPYGSNSGEPVKVGRACGENGRRSPVEDSRSIPRGRRKEARRRLRLEECVKSDDMNAGVEGTWRGSTQQKSMEENSSEGD